MQRAMESSETGALLRGGLGPNPGKSFLWKEEPVGCVVTRGGFVARTVFGILNLTRFLLAHS